LNEALKENEKLRKFAQNYEKLEQMCQTKSHRIEVLERNLQSSAQQHEELKELKNLLQKQNNKKTEEIQLLVCFLFKL